MRSFPTLDNWEGEVKILIIDKIITRDVLARHLNDAGQFIGIGSLRPRQNGWHGRFTSEIIKWEE